MRQAEVFRTALGIALDREQSARARRDAQPRMLEVLAWTWDNITEPVLRRLGRTGPPPEGEPWPRVWWCPVGVVTMLPLHAAVTTMHRRCRFRDGPRHQLLHAHDPRIGPRPPRQSATPSTSVVTVPDAPDSPAAGRRGTGSRARAGIHPRRRGSPATATRAIVLRIELREHGIVHLACHGYADLRDPSASRLLLHDHPTDPLTLHTITRQNLQHAQLAYLSACSTTDTNQEQADEATHLTAAFQLAGYRNVIGTLWPINDQTAI